MWVTKKIFQLSVGLCLSSPGLYSDENGIPDREVTVEIAESEEFPLLVFAAGEGSLETVRKLIDEGASPDLRVEDFGITPLMAAASAGHLEVVRFLLEKGADLEAEDLNGQRALHHAAINDRNSIVKLLLEEGAEVNATDKSGATALSLASRTGAEGTLKVLLEVKKLDVNLGDSRGVTPLMWTAIKGQPKAAQLLTQKGADQALRSKIGATAADYASLLNSKEFEEIFANSND